MLAFRSVVWQVIRDALHLVPTFLGNAGKGQGPRYCPSIEGKIRRFGDREAHRIWLEPEGLSSHLVRAARSPAIACHGRRSPCQVYPNGLATGFPPDVQLALCRTIKGLEKVEMTRPGYAVRLYPRDQLFRSLISTNVG